MSAPLPSRRRAKAALPAPESADLSTLAFAEKGGPLLAVVGVAGGAGTTSIAYLVAATAARESRGTPVMVCDLGGPQAGMRHLAKVSSAASVVDVARFLGEGKRPKGSPFAAGEFGVRVIATGPELDQPVPDEGVIRLIGDARKAHGLTVVDCGTLTRHSERIVLAMATHIMWVMPATQHGVQRAASLFEVLTQFLPGKEVVFARQDINGDRAAVTNIVQLAEARNATVVLMPHLDTLAEHDTEETIEDAATGLQAIGTVLHR